MARILWLFSRNDCPLCEEAEALATELGVAFEYRDISTDVLLLEKYRNRIPVFHDPETGREHGAPIDPAALKDLAG